MALCQPVDHFISGQYRSAMRRAVTLAAGSLLIDDDKPPELAAGQARLGVDVVGLCGSDYKLFHGGHPYGRFPYIQGHEFSGVVLEFSAGYDGPLAVGDRVAVEPLIPCGRCIACARGRSNCCVDLKVLGVHVPGALADEIAVATSALYPVDGLDMELAALVEPVSIGLQAVVRGNVSATDTVVVLGAGPIGLAATLAASDIGARVLTVDIIAERLARAEVMGAELSVDTATSDLAAAVADFTGGAGATVVLDATGVPELIRSAFDLVAHSGSIVIVGISEKDVQIPVIQFSRKEVNVYGSRNNNGVFGRAVELVRAHQEEVRSWITHRISLEELPDMIAYGAAHPETVEKMIVQVNEQS